MIESISPMMATVGPGPAPSSVAFSPVIAMPFRAGMPSSASLSPTSFAVLNSRNPVSGAASTSSTTEVSQSLRRSTASWATAFSPCRSVTGDSRAAMPCPDLHSPTPRRSLRS